MTTTSEGENKSLSAEDELLALEKFEPKKTMFHSPEGIISRFRLSELPTQQLTVEDKDKYDSLLGSLKRYLDKRGNSGIRVQGNRQELVLNLINEPIRQQRMAFIRAQKHQTLQTSAPAQQPIAQPEPAQPVTSSEQPSA